VKTVLAEKEHKEKSLKRCNKCILPETYPDITFDKNGVCDICRGTEAKAAKRDQRKLDRELMRIVQWAKAQKKRYDCIVPFSGGKDSSYTIYYCKEKLGLNVLAVNFNNGLRTVAALKNIEKIVKRLGVGYACYGPGWDIMKKLYRAFVLKAGKFCFACDMGIWATVYRVAEQYDVPLIVSGFSAQIESLSPKIYSYNNKLFKTIAQGALAKAEMKDFLGYTTLQKILRRLKHFRLTRYRRQISLPDYIIWDDKEIKRVIAEELNWEKRDDGSSDHIDCLFAPMKNYFIVQKWGFGEKTTKYAAMVRSGEVKREEAIKESSALEGIDISEHKQRFKSLLDLSDSDIRAAKDKTHLVYL